MKCTIWAIPSEPVYSKLTNVINELSVKYDGPKFEPHMTLLGDIESSLANVKKVTKTVSDTFGNLELSLGPVSFSTTYFQCVFIRVNSTAKLMEANLLAKKELRMKNAFFMPHISLYYGNIASELREKISAEIKLVPEPFTVAQMAVTEAIDNPSDWKHL
jgi:2'-5' RNA ligase